MKIPLGLRDQTITGEAPSTMMPLESGAMISSAIAKGGQGIADVSNKLLMQNQLYEAQRAKALEVIHKAKADVDIEKNLGEFFDNAESRTDYNNIASDYEKLADKVIPTALDTFGDSENKLLYQAQFEHKINIGRIKAKHLMNKRGNDAIQDNLINYIAPRFQELISKATTPEEAKEYGDKFGTYIDELIGVGAIRPETAKQVQKFAIRGGQLMRAENIADKTPTTILGMKPEDWTNMFPDLTIEDQINLGRTARTTLNHIRVEIDQTQRLTTHNATNEVYGLINNKRSLREISAFINSKTVPDKNGFVAIDQQLKNSLIDAAEADIKRGEGSQKSNVVNYYGYKQQALEGKLDIIKLSNDPTISATHKIELASGTAKALNKEEKVEDKEKLIANKEIVINGSKTINKLWKIDEKSPPSEVEFANLLITNLQAIKGRNLEPDQTRKSVDELIEWAHKQDKRAFGLRSKLTEKIQRNIQDWRSESAVSPAPVAPITSFDQANLDSQARWVVNNEQKIVNKLTGKPKGVYQFPGSNFDFNWDGNGGFTTTPRNKK